MDTSNLQIPYVKPARIGNFKLWRSKVGIGSGKDKATIEAVNVSSLDGAWKVQIPSTMSLYGVICTGYATVDENLRDSFLGMIFANLYNLGTSASAVLHDAFFLLSEVMTFPYLFLSEKEMSKRMDKGMKALGIAKDKRKEHIAMMCKYRSELYGLFEKKKADLIAEYERQQQERMSKEEESMRALEQDEIAEQSMEVLNDEDIDTNTKDSIGLND